MFNVVFDTSVLVAGLLSKNGASYKLIEMIDSKIFKLSISVPLFKEYEAVLNRNKFSLSKEVIEDILDYIVFVSSHHKIYYLWRPVLKDIKDDMVLELAVKSNSIIVTLNKKDFFLAQKFGVEVYTPKEFLEILGEKNGGS